MGEDWAEWGRGLEGRERSAGADWDRALEEKVEDWRRWLCKECCIDWDGGGTTRTGGDSTAMPGAAKGKCTGCGMHGAVLSCLGVWHRVQGAGCRVQGAGCSPELPLTLFLAASHG